MLSVQGPRENISHIFHLPGAHGLRVDTRKVKSEQNCMGSTRVKCGNLKENLGRSKTPCRWGRTVKDSFLEKVAYELHLEKGCYRHTELVR